MNQPDQITPGLGDNRLAVLAGEIVAAVAQIKASAEVIAERALSAGRALNEAKAALPHGQWEAWLKQNVSMSTRSARRYMQLAASGVETATVADLGLRGATEAIAAPGRTQARRQAQELARLLTEGRTPAEVDTLMAWAEKAAKKDPEQSVAQALANDLSAAWLQRKWDESDEPVRRRFIEWLKETKQA